MSAVHRIAVLTGTRAEYGLFQPLLDELARRAGFATSLIVTGTHLSPRFGMTVEEIEHDGHRIAARVPLPLDDDSELDVSRAMAAALAGVAEALHAERPDLLVLLGDRYETLAAACAALLTRVPIAHLHGGELSQGATDDAMRHAVTKMSWLHFPATATAARRIEQLGEDPVARVRRGGPRCRQRPATPASSARPSSRPSSDPCSARRRRSSPSIRSPSKTQRRRPDRRAARRSRRLSRPVDRVHDAQRRRRQPRRGRGDRPLLCRSSRHSPRLRFSRRTPLPVAAGLGRPLPGQLVERRDRGAGARHPDRRRRRAARPVATGPRPCCTANRARRRSPAP